MPRKYASRTFFRHRRQGIVLAGGGSLLKGLDLLLRDQTAGDVRGRPAFAVANGTGKVLDEFDLLSTISLD